MNFTNLASIDYAFISQFVSNFTTYLATQWPTIKEQLAATVQEVADSIPSDFGDVTNCFHNYQTHYETTAFYDGDVVSLQECPSTDELTEHLDNLIRNYWQYGETIGTTLANLFYATINAP